MYYKLFMPRPRVEPGSPADYRYLVPLSSVDNDVDDDNEENDDDRQQSVYEARD